MGVKRKLSVCSSPSPFVLGITDNEPPKKRRQLYPPRPFDSPSNPFGRKSRYALTHTLPPPTSFSKHLPLRFQLIRSSISPRMGGVYRTVQVPLSYTFLHLRSLIAFLYGAGYATVAHRRHLFEVKENIDMYSPTYKPGHIKSGATIVKLSAVQDPCRSHDDDDDAFTAAATPPDDNTDEDSDEKEGWKWAEEDVYTLAHVWLRGGDPSRGIIYQHDSTTAVHITINTGPLPRRKGVSNIPFVFNGRGRIRILPPAPPPPLPRPLFAVPASDLAVSSSPLRSRSPESRVPNSEDADGEDVVEDGIEFGDASDDPSFFADGTEQSPKYESDDEDEEQEEDTTDDPTIVLLTDKYNAPDAFATYLKFVHTRERMEKFDRAHDSSDSDNEQDDEGLESTPGLISPHAHPLSSSSPLPPTPRTNSSPFSLRHSSSPAPMAGSNSFNASLGRKPASTPFGARSPASASAPAQGRIHSYHPHPYIYTPTPAPAHEPWQRRRLDRIVRHMERAKRGKWMCARDEREDDAEKDADGEKDAEGEVDELLEEAVWEAEEVLEEDEEEEEVQVEARDRHGKMWKGAQCHWTRKGRDRAHRSVSTFVPPVMGSGEVWDPFGDEVEL